jgi:hypothetical protein
MKHSQRADLGKWETPMSVPSIDLCSARAVLIVMVASVVIAFISAFNA